jgi:outer membrane protein OmpA-like peptidoglycan-associated protein
MRNYLQQCTLCGIFLLLSGCASYSGLVNSFAPEKKKGLMDTAAIDSKPSGKSPFCVEPPKPIREIYMVMPEEGKAGTVDVVFRDGQALQLHGAYSALSLAGDDKNTYIADQQQMKNTFGEAVSALPKAPIFATLYFVFGKDELTPGSKADAEEIYSDFIKRQAPEVLIVGHTDTVGSVTDNLRLSLRRAEKVKQALIQLGIPAESIKTSGDGESELLIATPDKTKEPKNRRVEINVR